MISRSAFSTLLMAGLLAVLAASAISGCYNSNKNYGTNPPPSGSLELSSGNLATGGSYRHAFADSGAFLYHCTIHSCMTHGTVTVTAAGADSAVVTIVSPGGGCAGGYTPLAVSVRPGGAVRWVNQSVTHTVTSD